MRLDHIAYRVADRHKTVDFFKSAFGYTVQTEFNIEFSDGSQTKCFALEPPEKPENIYDYQLQWTHMLHRLDDPSIEFHMAPEIFVSDGDAESIVGKWVNAYREGGEKALKAKQKGRPKGGTLLPWQSAQIAKAVVDR